MNLAQQLHQAIGIAQGDVTQKQAHGNKNVTATKGGPGRYHRDGAKKDRAPLGRGRVSTHEGRQRTYQTLMAHFASQRVSKPGRGGGDGTNKRGQGWSEESAMKPATLPRRRLDIVLAVSLLVLVSVAYGPSLFHSFAFGLHWVASHMDAGALFQALLARGEGL